MGIPKWHYFMHSTASFTTIRKILTSGEIKSSGYERESEMDSDHNYCKKAVYCNYIFDEIPLTKPQIIWNNTGFVIVLHANISKDLEMYICDSVAYGSCYNHKEEQLLHTKGKLERMPSLQRIRDYILEKINSVSGKKREIGYSYIHNHEVLFPSIPIKYIAAILVPRKQGVYVNVKDKNGLPMKRRLADVEQSILEKYITENNLSIKVFQYSKTGDFHQYFEKI